MIAVRWLLVPGAALALLPLFIAGGDAGLVGQGPGWDDASPEGQTQLAAALAQEAPVRTIQTSLALIPTTQASESVLFLFPNYRNALPGEMEAVRSFVEAGGFLVMAVDGPAAEPWLGAFGIAMQGFPALLGPGQGGACVPFAYRMGAEHIEPCLPSPTAFARVPDSTGGTARDVRVEQASIPIVLDLDLDGNISIGDQGPAHFPMVLGWDYGAGSVLALPDGDLWRNGNLDAQGENLRLARSLARTGASGTVYLDSASAPVDAAGAARASYFRAMASSTGLNMAPFVLIWIAIVVGCVTARRSTPTTRHVFDLNREDSELEARAMAFIELEREKTSAKPAVSVPDIEKTTPQVKP